MSHDAESADSLLLQLARMRAELALARAVCDELQHELHDERARAAARRDRARRKMRYTKSRPRACTPGQHHP
jgi:hypothetical protein